MLLLQIRIKLSSIPNLGNNKMFHNEKSPGGINTCEYPDLLDNIFRRTAPGNAGQFAKIHIESGVSPHNGGLMKGPP